MPADGAARAGAKTPVPARWRLQGQWAAAVLVGLACLVAGLVAGRADVVVVGTPLIMLAALSLRAGRRTPRELRIDDAAAGRFGDLVRMPVHAADADGLLVLALAAPGCRSEVLVFTASPAATAAAPRPGTHAGAGPPSDDGAPPGDGAAPLTITAMLPPSGTRELFSYTHMAISADAAAIQQPCPTRRISGTVLPAIRQFPALPLPHRLTGRTGGHSWRAPGDGSDIRDVHPFQPGDRLRRIDWRTTARRPGTGDELYVRRNFADAEAHVSLAVDSSLDLSAEVDTWFGGADPALGTPSSLHLAREAAAAVAASYLRSGDRVGLTEMATYRRPLRAASGHRQLELIRVRLAALAADSRRPRPLQDASIGAGHLVVAFTPFMDDDAERLLRQWQHLGHRVIGVDTLPVLAMQNLEPARKLAVRLLLTARADRILRLQHEGIEVLGWRGPAPADRVPSGGEPGPRTGDIPGQIRLGPGLHLLMRARMRPDHG